MQSLAHAVSCQNNWLSKDEHNVKLNEEALQNYRDGWAVGDSDVILAYSPNTFTFTWLPANNQVVFSDMLSC